jgi:hypothetical protein
VEVDMLLVQFSFLKQLQSFFFECHNYYNCMQYELDKKKGLLILSLITTSVLGSSVQFLLTIRWDSLRVRLFICEGALGVVVSMATLGTVFAKDIVAFFLNCLTTSAHGSGAGGLPTGGMIRGGVDTKFSKTGSKVLVSLVVGVLHGFALCTVHPNSPT